MTEDLPHEVCEVFARTLTCEMTTLSREEQRPITAPMLHLWRPDQRDFILSSGIIIPSKLYRIQRDPRVALSFTEFVGTGLSDPPAVLVQGTATVDDQVYGAEGMEDFWKELFRKKPASQDLVFDPDERRVDTRVRTYWRARITVRPRSIWTLRGKPGEQERERVL
ncbi:pyridoxamine 5'-phosphate oxidase [Streptomyces sp. NPDC048436]|uniref:pyridoxamine 5'-phosphate oxidase n=1 Tax=Streptomyces sp. NPDC048436 TaxID=3365550 RepID=UPI003718BD10